MIKCCLQLLPASISATIACRRNICFQPTGIWRISYEILQKQSISNSTSSYIVIYEYQLARAATTLQYPPSFKESSRSQRPIMEIRPCPGAKRVYLLKSTGTARRYAPGNELSLLDGERYACSGQGISCRSGGSNSCWGFRV